MRQYIISIRDHMKIIGYTDKFIEPQTHYGDGNPQPGQVEFNELYYFVFAGEKFDPTKIKAKTFNVPLDDITDNKKIAIKRIFSAELR